jgi:hypothetical protein
MRLLAGVRNGIVHLGEHDAAIGERTFVPYLRYAKLLLEAMGIAFDNYFLNTASWPTRVSRARLRL